MDRKYIDKLNCNELLEEKVYMYNLKNMEDKWRKKYLLLF